MTIRTFFNKKNKYIHCPNLVPKRSGTTHRMLGSNLVYGLPDMGDRGENQMEKDTNRAILIVSISNPNRLNASNTEDFFLVSVDDYAKAVTTLASYEESEDVDDIVDSTSGARTILIAAGIDFEHVMEGRRFFFDNTILPDDNSCDD